MVGGAESRARRAEDDPYDQGRLNLFDPGKGRTQDVTEDDAGKCERHKDAHGQRRDGLVDIQQPEFQAALLLFHGTPSNLVFPAGRCPDF